MKNLKDEYNSNIENNLPDLWDRIEKGLDEAEGPRVPYNDKVPFYSTKIFKIACSVAGAAACLLLVITVAKPSFFSSKSYNGSRDNRYEAKQSDSKQQSSMKMEDAKMEDSSSSYEPLPTPTAAVLSESYTEDEYCYIIDDMSDKLTELDDGTYMFGDSIYQYRLELDGIIPAEYGNYAGLPARCVVVTNNPEITFDRIAASVLSNSTDTIIGSDEAIIISFETGRSTE